MIYEINVIKDSEVEILFFEKKVLDKFLLT